MSFRSHDAHTIPTSIATMRLKPRRNISDEFVQEHLKGNSK